MKTCIHTVILNELDEYLKSWLDHHSKMVDQIFIFEDIGSWSHKHITDQYPNVTLLSVLDLYADDETKRERIIKEKAKGIITQMHYIKDGVTMIQNLHQYDWCFTLDIDEFITLQEPYKDIPSVMSEFQDKCAVILQWQNYGASGRIYKPNYNGEDYRKFYTEKAPFNSNDAALKITSKIAWNLNKITKWHLCGLHCTVGDWVNTKGKRDRQEICYDKMYLAHYVTRSWEEWIWKLYIRGNHCGHRHRKIDHFFEINPSMMNKYDECMKFKEEYFKKHNITDE